MKRFAIHPPPQGWRHPCELNMKNYPHDIRVIEGTLWNLKSLAELCECLRASHHISRAVRELESAIETLKGEIEDDD